MNFIIPFYDLVDRQKFMLYIYNIKIHKYHISIFQKAGLPFMLKTNIKQYRAKHQLSQQELANRVGVRRETIGHLERGSYNPSLKLAWDIACIFDVPIEEIFQYMEEE